jgi:hypothetical protein
MEMVDDFQVTKARLRYKVETGETADSGNLLTSAATTQTLELDVAVPAARLSTRFDWRLANVRPVLEIGSRLEYWLEADDNNDVTGPGRAASEHRFARIVTDEEKRAELWSRATDTLSGVADLATDQEKLNQNLRDIIREKRQ